MRHGHQHHHRRAGGVGAHPQLGVRRLLLERKVGVVRRRQPADERVLSTRPHGYVHRRAQREEAVDRHPASSIENGIHRPAAVTSETSATSLAAAARPRHRPPRQLRARERRELRARERLGLGRQRRVAVPRLLRDEPGRRRRRRHPRRHFGRRLRRAIGHRPHGEALGVDRGRDAGEARIGRHVELAEHVGGEARRDRAAICAASLCARVCAASLARSPPTQGAPDFLAGHLRCGAHASRTVSGLQPESSAQFDAGGRDKERNHAPRHPRPRRLGLTGRL